MKNKHGNTNDLLRSMRLFKSSIIHTHLYYLGSIDKYFVAYGALNATGTSFELIAVKPINQI